MATEEPRLRAWSTHGLPGRALLAANARQGELRHAVRVAVAVGAAYVLAALLHLPQGYWAVFTAVIVVQTSLGGTLTAAFERLIGTVVGGLLGACAAYLKGRTVIEEGLILSAVVAILSFGAAVRPSLRVAPITAAIVLIGGTSTRMDPLLAAGWRVLEILLGSLVGVGATLLIFPARARRTVLQRTGDAMTQLAEIFSLFVRAMAGETLDDEIFQTHQTIRRSLSAVEQSTVEASREDASGFRDAAVPESLLRTLWRVRNDAVMASRALANPLPASITERLVPSAAGLLSALADALGAWAVAIQNRAPIGATSVEAAQATFEVAVAEVRAARLTADMTVDAASRLFGLVFALESLVDNIADLGDRLAEMSPSPPETKPQA